MRFITYGGFCCLRVRDVVLKPISIAASLAPEDPEIAFNLAAVLEACGFLEESLEQYKKSSEFGVERAAMHARNVSMLSTCIVRV